MGSLPAFAQTRDVALTVLCVGAEVLLAHDVLCCWYDRTAFYFASTLEDDMLFGRERPYGVL